MKNPSSSSDAAPASSAPDPRLQTPFEREAYRAAIRELSAPTPSAEERKLTVVKKSLRLIEAARVGDAGAVALWLAAGADPNYKPPGYMSLQALDHAIGSGSGESLVALMEAGARLTDGPEDPTEEQRRAAILSKLDYKGSLEAMRAVTERYGEPTAADWAERLIAAGSGRLFEISHWLKESQRDPSPEQWGRLLHRGLMTQIYLGAREPRDAEGQRARKDLTDFLRAFAKSAPQPALEAIFGECAWRDHKPGLTALLEAGLRPAPDWKAGGPAAGGSPTREPLMAIAALGHFKGLGAGECLGLLERFEPAAAAARSEPVSPKELAQLSVIQGLRYAARGLPIDGVDAKGDNAAHLWARQSPIEDGWKTLLKTRPDLALAQNAEGKSAFDILLSRVNPEDRAEYQKSLAGSERKSLMKESKASAPKPAAPAPKRARL